MRRPMPPRERRGGTCPPARPGGSFFGDARKIKTLAMSLVVRVTSRGFSAFCPSPASRFPLPGRS